MYATSLLLCAVLAQTPPTSLGDPTGNPPAPAARPETDSPSAPASKVSGYDTPAPPFEGQAPAAATSGAAEKQPPVDTPPPAAGEIAEEEAARRAAEAKARSERTEPAMADPAAAQAPVDKSLVPIQPRPSVRNLASEVLTNAISLPVEGRVAGRPITLVDVLRQVPDRTAQRRATEEYWKLVEALAFYHFAWDECQQLERLKPAAKSDTEPTPDEQLMSTRIAAAQARLHDAELGIVTAQYKLADAINLKPGQSLPLPTDAPHVGPYSTLLYEMYQAKGTVPPPRAVLLDRTMPIRRSAVDARAVAVQSAVDALDAVEEAYYDGRADLKLVLSLIEELSRQRRAFFADVRAYNNEIAEYAMGVPPPPGGAVALASMLIRPTTPTAIANTGIVQAGATTGGAANGVERAGINAPIGQPNNGQTVLPASGQQPVTGQAPVVPPPTAQPPRAATPPNGRAPAGATPPAGGIKKVGEPTLAPPRGSVEPGEQGKLPTGAVVEPPPATPRQANRMQTGGESSAAAGGAAAVNPTAPEPAAPAAAKTDPAASHEQSLYPALLRMPADQQAKNLAGILFWHPTDATPDIAPIPLDEFLAAIRPEGRKTALTAYWQSQRMAATRGALVSQIEQFDSLDQELQRPTSTLDPAAALLVRAARSAAEAEARRAEADCKVAQWDLAMLMGRPATGAWLSPSTSPHAGGYRLNLDQLPTALGESKELQRLAAAIARRPSSFCERAAAVVSADKSRVTEVTNSGGTLAGIERATLAIQAQTEYTITFATDLAEYNQDLADYALLVLPQGTPNSMLVQALVLNK